MIKTRTRYSDEVRQARLDDAINHLSWLLGNEMDGRTWKTLGPVSAHYRLHSAYDYLVQALFAYNRHWRTLKSREVTDLLNLAWLPNQFEELNFSAMNALSDDLVGYQQRLTVLNRFFKEIVAQCQFDGLYGDRVGDEAFIRQHDEPGRDWNMAEWVEQHHASRLSLD
ncbi:MAG: hypothetical protein AB8G95_09805 [Anaerolineae bacterium]